MRIAGGQLDEQLIGGLVGDKPVRMIAIDIDGDGMKFKPGPLVGVIECGVV